MIRLTRKLTLYTLSSSRSSYRPLMPLTEPFNLIFSQPHMKTLLTKEPVPALIYYLPATAMLLNNFLTSWAWYNSLFFVTFLLGGSVLKTFTNDSHSLNLYSLQTDPLLKFMYLTVKRSLLTKQLNDRYEVKNPQLDRLLNSFHPFKDGSNIKISNELIKNLNNQVPLDVLNKVMAAQLKIYRLKIPKNDVQFFFDLNSDQKLQYNRDLQRLSPKQMMKKYENFPIMVKIFNPDKRIQEILYTINAKANNNKRFHDYLMGLALGYDIDVSANKVKEEYKNEQEEQLGKDKMKNENK